MQLLKQIRKSHHQTIQITLITSKDTFNILQTSCLNDTKYLKLKIIFIKHCTTVLLYHLTNRSIDLCNEIFGKRQLAANAF